MMRPRSVSCWLGEAADAAGPFTGMIDFGAGPLMSDPPGAMYIAKLAIE